MSVFTDDELREAIEAAQAARVAPRFRKIVDAVAGFGGVDVPTVSIQVALQDAGYAHDATSVRITICQHRAKLWRRGWDIRGRPRAGYSLFRVDKKGYPL